ncbi:unnamed protein product [Pleuronectes platessa]|uniref:Uncharacterized protein n=1 Tax=Pleuronectes platessa TaxID=8262 RepID=A0A9N7UFS3_PLEPL|nr:unnamed protein product [Pleuronectes platessa]
MSLYQRLRCSETPSGEDPDLCSMQPMGYIIAQSIQRKTVEREQKENLSTILSVCYIEERSRSADPGGLLLLRCFFSGLSHKSIKLAESLWLSFCTAYPFKSHGGLKPILQLALSKRHGSPWTGRQRALRPRKPREVDRTRGSSDSEEEEEEEGEEQHSGVELQPEKPHLSRAKVKVEGKNDWLAATEAIGSETPQQLTGSEDSCGVEEPNPATDSLRGHTACSRSAHTTAPHQGGLLTKRDAFDSSLQQTRRLGSGRREIDCDQSGLLSVVCGAASGARGQMLDLLSAAYEGDGVRKEVDPVFGHLAAQAPAGGEGLEKVVTTLSEVTGHALTAHKGWRDEGGGKVIRDSPSFPANLQTRKAIPPPPPEEAFHLRTMNFKSAYVTALCPPLSGTARAAEQTESFSHADMRRGKDVNRRNQVWSRAFATPNITESNPENKGGEGGRRKSTTKPEKRRCGDRAGRGER